MFTNLFAWFYNKKNKNYTNKDIYITELDFIWFYLDDLISIDKWYIHISICYVNKKYI